MKPIYAHLGGALALTFTIAACVPAPDSTPAPTASTSPAPPPAPAPAPAPTPIASYDSWMDVPATPGNWTFRSDSSGTLASFGGSPGASQFTIRCDRPARAVILSRAGQSGAPVSMQIRTETLQRALTARPSGGDQSYLTAQVPAGDPLLDAMALTKGRFAVEAPNLPTLYLPAWAEVTRVIEDCR